MYNIGPDRARWVGHLKLRCCLKLCETCEEGEERKDGKQPSYAN